MYINAVITVKLFELTGTAWQKRTKGHQRRWGQSCHCYLQFVCSCIFRQIQALSE